MFLKWETHVDGINFVYFWGGWRSFFIRLYLFLLVFVRLICDNDVDVLKNKYSTIRELDQSTSIQGKGGGGSFCKLCTSYLFQCIFFILNFQFHFLVMWRHCRRSIVLCNACNKIRHGKVEIEAFDVYSTFELDNSYIFCESYFIDNVLARISSAEDIRQTYFYYFTVSRRNLLSSNYALHGTWENRWPSTVENVPFGKFLSS